MERHIVYSKELTKADTLILKNLDADIHHVSAKPISDGSKPPPRLRPATQ